MVDTVKITVTRAFCIGGVAQEVSSSLEVSKALSVELISLGKAELAADKPAKGKKEKKDEPV